MNSDYLQAIIRTQNDSEIVRAAKKLFGKEINQKTNFLQFNISNKIVFINIGGFLKQLGVNNQKAGINSSDYEDIDFFLEKYKFPPEEDDFMNELFRYQTHLTLYFSKRIGNVLAAEITNDTDIEKKPMAFREGKGLIMLFFFNEKNLIEDVSIKPLEYH